MKNRVLGKLSWLTVAAFTAAAALLAAGCEQYLENTDKKAAVTVTIEGTAQVDSTLTAKVAITGLTEEAIAALEPLYQWERADGPNWTEIDYQVSEKYTPAAGDLNKYLRVGVKVEGYGEAFIKSEATAQVATGDGTIQITSANTGIMAKSTTRQFSASGAQAVTWSVKGALDEEGESTLSTGTTISNTGLLTVGADEPNITLTVKAVSTGNPTVEATATVKVKGWKKISMSGLFSGAGIKGIAYGAGKWVAVGLNGKIATYVDGESWEAATSPTTKTLSKVIYDGPESGKKFIAISDVILYSTDGATWGTATITTSDSTYAPAGITYGNNQFIAIDAKSNSATMGLLTSSDGISWTRKTSDFTNLGGVISNPRIAFGNGKIVCTIGSNDRIVTTVDGETWTLVAKNGGPNSDTSITGYSDGLLSDAESERLLRDIIFDGNRFIAVGKNARIAISTNNELTSWTLAKFGSDLGLTTPSAIATVIIFADGKYVTTASTAASGGTNKLIYASSLTGNGASGWKAVDDALAINYNYNFLAYGDGKFITMSSVNISIAHKETLD
jgi:hypothetical protein